MMQPFFQDPSLGAQVILLATSSKCSEELHGKFHRGKSCLFYFPMLIRSFHQPWHPRLGALRSKRQATPGSGPPVALHLVGKPAGEKVNRPLHTGMSPCGELGRGPYPILGRRGGCQENLPRSGTEDDKGGLGEQPRRKVKASQAEGTAWPKARRHKKAQNSQDSEGKRHLSGSGLWLRTRWGVGHRQTGIHTLPYTQVVLK